MHVSERAYVGITPSLAKPPAAGERLQFVATLNNSGRTPAIEMISHVTGVVSLSSESANQVYAEVTKTRSSSPSGSESIATLSPGATAKNIIESTALTQPDLDQIIEGKVLIRIFANASYKDIFGHSHLTEICFFYKPAGNAFLPCHEFNKSD
jgi:hypothetical protein